MSHTKGEWMLDETKRWISTSWTPGQPMIAHLVSDASRPSEENDANARLIAAAPDLLEACNAVLGSLLYYPGEFPKELEVLRKAIAKTEAS